MPGVDHTGNSVMTALVTSDPKKAKVLGEKYEVEATFPYEEFPKALASGTFDSIYLATPNWRHAEFMVPAIIVVFSVVVQGLSFPALLRWTLAAREKDA